MIQDTFRSYIEEHQLFDKDAKLLLAVSGGGDSMAMLDLLHKEGYHCEIAHVNFQLRGIHSDRDEALVKAVCKAKGLKLHSMRISTRLYAMENKLSIEMAAREIRYDFFEQILKTHKLDCVAVAHHRNDVVETFFINLLRGTGLKGLGGIAPKNGNIVRPLLSLTHQDLISYLDEHNLEYCTDETNFDTTILRNEIRHHIIPDFEEKKQGFTGIMQRTISRLRQSEAVVIAYVQEWKEKHVLDKDGDLYIPMETLYSSVSASEILFNLLQPLGFSIAVIDELAANDSLRVGARFDSSKYRLIVDREYLIIGNKNVKRLTYDIDKESQKLEVPLTMVISLFFKSKSFKLVRDEKIALLDCDKLKFPLKMRRWQEGDVFCPIGMGGQQKKISDYFIDQKFSIPEKEKTWLLCSGEDIVWVVGHRLDERYKVTDETKSIFEIRL